MKLGLSRRLFVQLGASVALAFLVTLGITFVVGGLVVDSEARELMRRQLVDIRGQIEERIDRRLLMTAMTVRDRLPSLPDQTCATYRALAEEMSVDEICLADKDGMITASTHDENVGCSFASFVGGADAFMCLLDTEIEFTQPVRPSANGGAETKFVGVWLPEGGFIQVGCRLPAMRRLTMTALYGLTHDIHVAGHGVVVITTERGQIISDAREFSREGAMFEPPSEDDYYCLKDTVSGFPVYVIVPRQSMMVERNVFMGFASILVLAALIFVAVLVAVVIAGFVRAQLAKQLAADMAMARSIQTSSLPRVFPPYPALVKNFDIHAVMRPAKEVGGDFYDFYHTGPNELALVIADVSGKGVPAAMFMMKAKTTLKAFLAGGGDLASVVRSVNDALAEGNDDNLFVTAWIGIVDLTTGRIRYVNAGHNPPLVKSAAGEVRALTGKPGLPLAAFGGYRYTVQEMELAPGETLLLYTDGITEAANGAEELFGDARLEAAFAEAPTAAEELCRTIIVRTDAFANGAPQADDMTLLAYRFLAPRNEKPQA